MPGINSRSKGRRGEREVVNLIHSLTGIKLNLNYAQTYGGGADILECPGFAIEIKRYSRYTQADVRRWWKQAVEQADAVNLLPCLFHRADRGDWLVTIPHDKSLSDKIFAIDDFRIAISMSSELFCAILREYYV